MLFQPDEIVSRLEAMGISHVVWVPDSTLGTWESCLCASARLRLVRVCREGEAWPLAAGLYLGGQSPLVVMQSTGLFESGDALRNVLFDMACPLFAIVGARYWLNADGSDSARRLILPVASAWGVPLQMIESPADKQRLEEHYAYCRAEHCPGLVLLAEGSG
jgi:sulfopyruvate decarboxylase TPP-binding subunit